MSETMQITGFVDGGVTIPVEQPATEVAPETPEAAAEIAPEIPAVPEVTETPVTQPQIPAPPPVPVAEQPEPADPFKLLGVEDKEGFEKILNAYKTNKLRDYLDVATKDYDTMSDEELIRSDIKEQYPGIGKNEVDILLNRKLRDYNITGNEEDDVEGKLIMKLEANKIRDGFKKRQSEFVLPEYKAPEVANNEDLQKQLAERQRQHEEQMLNHPIVKQFETNRMFEMGEGEGKFNFEVPQTTNMRDMLTGQDAFTKMFYDEKGELNMSKWMKVINYAANMQDVEKALINHGKTLGSKEDFVERTNPAPTEVAATPSPAKSWEITGYRNGADY